MRANVDKIFLLLLVHFLVGRVHGEIFSAIDELGKLAEAETQLMEAMRVFARKEDDYYLNKKLQEYEDEHEFMKRNVEKYITNPLNAFMIIKRWTLEADVIAQRFPGRSDEFLKKVKEAAGIGYDDLSGAVEGLLRLQKIYRFKSEDLANGIIDGKKTRQEMNALDLFVIGEEGFKLNGYDVSVKEYLELSWDRIKHGGGGEIPLESLQLRLITIYERLGEYEYAIDVLEDLILKFPRNIEFVQKRDEYLEKKPVIGQLDPEDYVRNGVYTVAKEEILTGQVCRGDVAKTSEEEAELHCRYVANSAFSKLAPAKVEEANLKPYLVIFVDVLSKEEIHFLKHYSKAKIDRGKIMRNEERVTSNERIAKIGWLYDQEHEIIARISRRVEALTGLSQKSFEPLQVQNYGIGGHYVPHWDHTIPRQPPFDNNGNRIATLLFYLSDVERGGETIFPYLKVRIPPRKGSAAFWYNLKQSGDSEYATRHSACPVVLGSKWVANKWIREHWQETRRPCLPEVYEEEPESFYIQGFF